MDQAPSRRCLFSRWPGLGSKSAHVKSMVDKDAVGKVLLRAFLSLLCSTNAPYLL